MDQSKGHHFADDIFEFIHLQIFAFWIFRWWRHQMEVFSALLAMSAGNSPVPGEFPTQRPVTQSFDVFFDLLLNKRSSKKWWSLWFETLSRPLWRHRYALKFVPKGPINKTGLVQIMARHRSDDQLLSERIMAYFTDAYMHHPAQWINI